MIIPKSHGTSSIKHMTGLPKAGVDVWQEPGHCETFWRFLFESHFGIHVVTATIKWT